MKFARRLLYFGSGFLIGIVLLMFFLGGKRASCDYGPTARTLKNIRSKALQFDEEAMESLRLSGLDTAQVNSVLRQGEVDFGASETRLDSCKIYQVNGAIDSGILSLRIQNCEKVAKVMSVRFDSP